jgi:hypothetical protein
MHDENLKELVRRLQNCEMTTELCGMPTTDLIIHVLESQQKRIEELERILGARE